MDLILLRGIRAHGRHGANPGERDRDQPFDIDLKIECDLTRAEYSDALADTLDYAAVHARVVEIVRTRSFALLERLAGDVLADLFTDSRVRAAEITIAKPALLDGATPAVRLRRSNPAHA